MRPDIGRRCAVADLLQADKPATVPRLALNVAEAAQAVGISERELWRRIAGGELPVVRIGRRALIHVAALDAYLAARSAPAGNATGSTTAGGDNG